MAQAHHIAFKVGDGEKTAAVDHGVVNLRVGNTVEIIAAARSQSGKVLESIPVTLAIEKNKDEAITLEGGMLEAVGIGSAEIKAESELAGISGILSVKVSNPVHKVVLMRTGNTDPLAELVLAITEEATIVAVAHDEDGTVISHDALLSSWEWESDAPSVATVAAVMEDKKLKDKGRHGTVTGKAHGDAMITAMVEGVSSSIAVRVTPGQTTTRFMRASTSDHPSNAFTADVGGDWEPAETITFRVSLYDEVSRDAVVGGTIIATVSGGGSSAILVTGDGVTDDGGGVDIAVTPTISKNTAYAKQPATITLNSTGADPIKVRFTIEVKPAPAQ